MGELAQVSRLEPMQPRVEDRPEAGPTRTHDVVREVPDVRRLGRTGSQLTDGVAERLRSGLRPRMFVGENEHRERGEDPERTEQGSASVARSVQEVRDESETDSGGSQPVKCLGSPRGDQDAGVGDQAIELSSDVVAVEAYAAVAAESGHLVRHGRTVAAGLALVRPRLHSPNSATRVFPAQATSDQRVGPDLPAGLLEPVLVGEVMVEERVPQIGR